MKCKDLVCKDTIEGPSKVWVEQIDRRGLYKSEVSIHHIEPDGS